MTMYKQNIYSCFIALFLLILASCGKDEGFAGRYGYVDLSISQDESVIIKGTKSGEEPIFRVVVKNASGVRVASYESHKELESSPLKLPAGLYTISASTGELSSDGTLPQAVFDKPVYEGQTEVEVVAGKINPAKVTCTLSQVKVTVSLDQQIKDNFPTVIVTVTNSENFENSSTNLIFNSTQPSIDQEGYFSCTGSLKYKIYLVNNDNEISDGDLQGSIENVKPREHYRFNLQLSTEDHGSAIIPGVSIDSTTNDKIFDVVVGLNKKKKPLFTTSGFDLGKTSVIPVGSELSWQVNITAAAGFKEFKMMHSSAELLSRGIPNIVDLLNVSEETKSACLAAGIVWENFVSGGVDPAKLDFSALIKQLPLGDYSIAFSVVDGEAQFVDCAFNFNIIPSVETSTTAVEPWGKHAIVNGVYNTLEQPVGMRFEYKKASDVNWIKVSEGLNISGTSYSAKITGLEPKTEYVVRTASDAEPSNEITFTTLGAEQIPNMSFDTWVKSGKEWYAAADLSSKLWDSGNEGANTISEVNPTTPEETNVAISGSGKKAARLESKSVFGNFAAGNLFTGDFGKATLSPLGAQLTFGIPYECKPLTLKGYYSYIPKVIDKASQKFENLKGTMDSFLIYVVLADWPSKNFAADTGNDKFLSPDTDEHVIAYGALEGNEDTQGYKPFEIQLEYKPGREKRIPTSCVIVCAASKYGDYFTGAVGSILYVDEFEFTF